jgi:excinuclease ABC subunit A
MTQGLIRIRGARQHNLKNLDLDIRTGELTVVTGPSGSGKSSLVFDTLYAEGQRRYVETFSAYARQFLDRMDKPAVDKVEGVPPAIAIDQTNPVRSSRSTVGTMTELNDHLKLLFARAGQLFDKQTAQPVRHDSPETIYAELQQRSAAAGDPRIVLTFPVELPANTSAEQVEQWLSASGFTKVQAEREVATPTGPRKVLDVVADRFRLGNAEKARVIEAIEVALRRGTGRLNVYRLVDEGAPELWRFSTGLHCPDSDLRYSDPTPSAFSFNSAVGACDSCRGFGRVIGVDYGLVVPNDKLTLRAGAIKTIQTPAWKEAQDDLMRHAETAGIPRDTPWYKLTEEQKKWVIGGAPGYKDGQWSKQWYGIKRFFEYLESKAYKMHIRVLLSKYRSYTPCPTCAGARLKTESLLWRIGRKEDADAVLEPGKRFMPEGVQWTREQLEALPGLCLHDLMLLPIDRLRRFFDRMQLPVGDDAKGGDAQALKLLHEEITTRLKYLCDVGIGYLTLDRQSRTLSGGEVQRINLTTALGTSLVNTLFVLDEPSIGLHPRDMHRITEAMLRLRDAGNTLVVVEHDPAVMLAADRMIDMGPGPGRLGGQIVFDGTTADLRQADTLTGAYLGGRKHVGFGFKRMVTESTPRLILEGAREHNLQDVTVEFPLQRLVTVTGVSGSGKSSLIQDVLAPALLRHFGKATDSPGAHDRMLGADHLSDVVFVDQSPIGKTARSNPVSYVGAWDSIRELFAVAPLSKQRSYTAAKFSFNSGDGRCPTCGGSGFEHVEMQFLSDVYLRCPDCDGKRYRPEILEITIERGGKSLNVADVLALTVAEAAAVFANDRDVIRALQPIVDVGLEYVALGQPVPTLSGGEAQRLKLAGFLAEAAKTAAKSRQALARKGTLFLFDEPTTGLHFDDIAKLMRALRKLIDAGHSLIVIEHNLDVIRASDWLIDLGPEGGDAGGLIVAEGTPEDVRQHATSHTGQALRDYELALGVGGHSVHEKAAALRKSERMAHINQAPAAKNAIEIVNAKEHNLKNLSVDIPRGKFNVVTGVSGSGKSTLAFDILFNEGQRRYLESLNAYARSIVQPAGRPEVDAVYGIPPTVAIEQRLSRGGRKSTVGTTTEVWHFLRLLYVKLGTQHCVKDGAAVQPQTPESIAAQLLTQFRGQHIGLLAPLVMNRKGVYTELADWARPRGYTHLRVDGNFLPTTNFPRIDRFKEHTIELPVASLDVSPENEAALRTALADALTHGKGVVHVLSGITGLREAMEGGQPTAGIGTLQAFSTKRACPVCAISYAELDPRLFSYNSKHGWCPDCVGTGVKLTKDQRKVFDDSVQDDRKRPRADLCRARGGRPGRHGLPHLQRHATERHGPRRAVCRRGHHRHRCAVRHGRAQLGGDPAHGRRHDDARGRYRPRPGARDPEPPGVSGRSGPGLPHTGPRRAHAQWRRGAAHPLGGAAGQQPAGRVLRTRRTHYRPARPRQPDPAQRPAQARRQGQHAGGGGARRRHHPPRRPHHRHWPERGQTWRAPGGAGIGARPHGRRRFANRPLLAARDEAPAATAPQHGGWRGQRRGHSSVRPGRGCSAHRPTKRGGEEARRPGRSAGGRCTHRGQGARCHALAHGARRAAAQPAERDRHGATAPPGGGDGRERLGQVHPGARWVAGQRAPRCSSAALRRARRDGCWRRRRWSVARAFRLEISTAFSGPTPIGKTPRSCPATYITSDTIRKLFVVRWRPRHALRGPGASVNTGEGRCPSCEGAGVRTSR